MTLGELERKIAVLKELYGDKELAICVPGEDGFSTTIIQTTAPPVFLADKPDTPVLLLIAWNPMVFKP